VALALLLIDLALSVTLSFKVHALFPDLDVALIHHLGMMYVPSRTS